MTSKREFNLILQNRCITWLLMVKLLMESKYEKCVLCGSQVEVLQETYIQNRECYILGVGQLCQKCHNKLKKHLEENN